MGGEYEPLAGVKVGHEANHVESTWEEEHVESTWDEGMENKVGWRDYFESQTVNNEGGQARRPGCASWFCAHTTLDNSFNSTHWGTSSLWNEAALSHREDLMRKPIYVKTLLPQLWNVLQRERELADLRTSSVLEEFLTSVLLPSHSSCSFIHGYLVPPSLEGS